MKPLESLVAIFLGTILLSASLAAAEAEDAERNWPQWRGPHSTGASPQADPPVQWSESQNVAWKVDIPGQGNGSPIVWGDRVYLLTSVPTREAETPQRQPDPEGRDPHGSVSPATHLQQFTVLALERSSGKVAWQRVVREALPHDGTHEDGTYASSSPVTDGEHLFVNWGSRGIYALDLEGNVLWEKDLGTMSIRRGFGEGSSPAVHGDKLIVLWDHQGQSFIVAFDKRTGEELWRVDRDEITSWTTPLVVEQGGTAQVVTSATQRVRSYDLENGELVWESEGVTLNAIPSPVAAEGVVYITSGFRGNVLRAVRLAAAKGDVTGTDAVLWTNDRDTPYVPSPLLYGDTLYLVKSNSAILSAWDVATGKQLYLERLEGLSNVYSSPVGAGGRVYVAGREGGTAVLAGGAKFELLAVNQLDDRFDASPAVAGGEIYLRGAEYLYRISE